MRFIKLQRENCRDYFQCRISSCVNFPINLRGFACLNKSRRKSVARTYMRQALITIHAVASKMPIICTRVCQSKFLFNPRACRTLRVNMSKQIIDLQLAQAVQGGLEINEFLITCDSGSEQSGRD